MRGGELDGGISAVRATNGLTFRRLQTLIRLNKNYDSPPALLHGLIRTDVSQVVADWIEMLDVVLRAPNKKEFSIVTPLQSLDQNSVRAKHFEFVVLVAFIEGNTSWHNVQTHYGGAESTWLLDRYDRVVFPVWRRKPKSFSLVSKPVVEEAAKRPGDASKYQDSGNPAKSQDISYYVQGSLDHAI